VRGWRKVDAQAEAREAVRQHASRALHVYPNSDGTVRLRGRLTTEVGALLVQALAAARETLYQQRRANATRSWSTSTPRSSQTPISRVSRSSRTVPAFPREHLSALRATPAG
jgi:hypothetical protein